MKNSIKVVIIVGICLVIGLVLLYLTMNNLIPFIQQMHSGMY